MQRDYGYGILVKYTPAFPKGTPRSTSPVLRLPAQGLGVENWVWCANEQEAVMRGLCLNDPLCEDIPYEHEDPSEVTPLGESRPLTTQASQTLVFKALPVTPNTPRVLQMPLISRHNP